jgi:septum formation protein
LAKTKLILASISPRRKYLLGIVLNNFGLKFDVIPANIKECIPENAKNYPVLVKKLALEKANEVAKKHKGVIIGADTIVVLNGKVLGKPRNREDAYKMLAALSGNEHKVYTGIAIINNDKGVKFTDYELSRVRFRKLEDKEILFYIKSGSPMDKAGAYGIQDDFGSTFVRKINGDYFNVVGLPIVKTYLGLKQILNINL